MQKNKLLQKLLAMFLIFVLTFADFALVTKSYAASFAETLFGTSSDTGHKNVEFEAFFGNEDDKQKEVKTILSDVAVTTSNLRKFSEKLNKRFLLFRLLF